MKSPPHWSIAELAAASEKAEEHFREGRHTEPLELYLELFDEYQGVVEEFLEQTVDLIQLEGHALDVLGDSQKQEVFRYISGPPVSVDDLKVLVQSRSLSSSRLESDPELVKRLLGFIQDWHDRRRFPWLTGEREAEEHERTAAVLATTALLALRRLETMRRNEGKRLQERLVRTQLRRSRFIEVATRRVPTLAQAPRPREFCQESLFGTRKADFLIGLWDGRTMALECKVSNSATNSVKRLNNDAAVKAETWRSDFGIRQVVPAAVLSGVYNVHNLEDAQSRGLALFWAHDLRTMMEWIHSTRA